MYTSRDTHFGPDDEVIGHAEWPHSCFLLGAWTTLLRVQNSNRWVTFSISRVLCSRGDVDDDVDDKQVNV